MAASPHDPILVAAICRQVQARGTIWFDAIKEKVADRWGDGVVLTSQGFADGGSHSGQIDMEPSEMLILLENVDQRLEGTNQGGAITLNHSCRPAFS